MRPEFLSALVDTLFPGDEAGLPTGAEAGVATRLADHLAAEPWPHLPVLQAIARQAGGEPDFALADESMRTAVLRSVEKEMGGAFRALVALVLLDYCEAEPVLVAMGWRAEPPQPHGHSLPPFNAALLQNMRKREKMWRE